MLNAAESITLALNKHVPMQQLNDAFLTKSMFWELVQNMNPLDLLYSNISLNV